MYYTNDGGKNQYNATIQIVIECQVTYDARTEAKAIDHIESMPFSMLDKLYIHEISQKITVNQIGKA